MKALRNFEALFIAIIGLACAANYALDNGAIESKAPAAYASVVQAAPIQGSHVVVVAAKRMTAAEKQASLAEERKATQPGSI
ncbi:hypothetical protein [Pseudoduganella sp. OTU4001]|uniref:hypothetical protein n=1 Tax=Pseudoduganella sp. OTU4001 TaxID=3043854 RepID=UPI00313A87B3